MESSYHTDILNLAAALDRVGGDQELLEEVARLFLQTSPSLLSEIEAAVAGRDPKGLERAAHTLKGSVGNFGADAVFQAAFQLEKLGRAGQLAGVDEAYQNLQTEMERLRPALAALGEGS